MRRVLFVGPSLSGEGARIAERFPALTVAPPASRGDVARAAADGAEAIGIVDGTFAEMQSVWHKEILFALERGVAVGGGGSMGALRAAECEAFGMVGIGAVFEAYRDGVLVDDEAVALVHGPAELDHVPLSVPWVTFEAVVLELGAAGCLMPLERDAILLAGRQLHFTVRDFAAALARCGRIDPERRRDLLGQLRACHVDPKRDDAWRVAEWLATAHPRPEAPAWRLSRTTQWASLGVEPPPRPSGHGTYP
jgi:hypothetical protein